MHINLKQIYFVLVIASMVLAGSIQQAKANPITFNLNGSVTWVDPVLSGTFNTAQSLSGFYTFESSTPEVSLYSGDPRQAWYKDALLNMTVSLNGYTAALTGPFPILPLQGIFVGDNIPSGVYAGLDRYSVFTDQLSGTSIAGYVPHAFEFDLLDDTQTAFSNDSLPLTPPDLSNFLFSKEWELTFIDPSTDFSASIKGNINSLTPIPEPSTLLLLGGGLAGLLGFRKKFKR